MSRWTLPAQQKPSGGDSLKRTVDHNLRYLRAAIETIGVEKPSDYTLVLEEVGRMEAEEKLVERVARAIFATDWPRDDWDRFGPKDNAVERYRAMARTAIEMLPSASLLTASEAFIREAEEMGWGKTSDKAYPGSFDLLLKAVREVRG